MTHGAVMARGWISSKMGEWSQRTDGQSEVGKAEPLRALGQLGGCPPAAGQSCHIGPVCLSQCRRC